MNTRVYDTVNNGVYRAGFATNQEAYEDAFYALFASLDLLEGNLGGPRSCRRSTDRGGLAVVHDAGPV